MRIEKLILALILFLAFFLRVYKLGSNPANFQRNEGFFGYNAYSILKTGKDINHKIVPLVFKYFERNEYFLPAYIYSTIPSIQVFGLSEFSTRLPSALFGTLTIILIYFLTLKLSSGKFKRHYALMSAFLLAISPWHLHFSRQSSPAVLSLFFLAAGTWFLLNDKRLIATLGFSLGLLSYEYHWLFAILLFFFLIFYKKNQKKRLRPLFFLLFLFLLLFRSFYKNSELIFTSIFFDEYFKGITLLEKVLKVLENYFNYFSFEYLFFSGDSYINHGIGELGLIYLTALPLFLIGLYQIFSKKLKGKGIILFWFFTSFIHASLFRFSPDSEKTLTGVIPLTIITAIGGTEVLKFLFLIKKKILKILTFSFFILIFSYDLISYLHGYWVHYYKRTQNEREAAFKPLIKLIKEKERTFDQIYITNDTDGATLFTLFYLKYDPKEFLKEQGTRQFFGKFIFTGIFRDLDKKTLIVTSFNGGVPSDFKMTEEIKFLNNNLAFVLWEK